MPRHAVLALFVSGIFFGGGLDHAIYIVIGSPVSHYGFRLGAGGHAAFAVLDFTIAAALYEVHRRFRVTTH
jgi:hypothetical protein